MKKEELIELLEKLPEDADALVGTDELEYACDLKQAICYTTNGKSYIIALMSEEVV